MSRPISPNNTLNEDVEVFLLPDNVNDKTASTKSLVMPSGHSRPVSAAKKRWNLVKTLTKVNHLTSLTLCEKRLLSYFEEGNHKDEVSHLIHGTASKLIINDGEDGSQQEEREDPAMAEARFQLRQAIIQKDTTLTSPEREFLKKILTMPNVEAEKLLQCADVLSKDPLYQTEAHHINIHDEKDCKIYKDRRQSLPQSQSSRVELWRALHHDELDASSGSLTFSLHKTKEESCHENEVKGEEQEDDDALIPEQGDYGSEWGSFVYKKIQKAFYIDDGGDNGEANENHNAELSNNAEADEEQDLTFCVLGTSMKDVLEYPLVLSPPMMDALRVHVPFALRNDNFWLKYSMVRDGASMRALMSKVRSSARTIIAIETEDGDVFGSFTSSPWRPQSDGYYGSCEAFVWKLRRNRQTATDSLEDQIKLECDVEVFAWSGKNRNIQCSFSMDSGLIVGGGEPDQKNHTQEFGFGFNIAADMERGTSNFCVTFDSPPLMATSQKSGKIFAVANIEVWTLTPVNSLDQAEKLEMGRQFIFDHGGFTSQ